MGNKFVYTPGPTMVRENVRFEMSKATTNPDVDKEFVEFYKNCCDKISDIIGAKNSDTYILSGEGILGLEAACASLTETGDKVLVIDNGVFGKGFDSFVELYGGEVTYFKGNYNNEINIDDLKVFLQKNNNFKYATIVHCDTPTGMLNNIAEICPLLKSYGIITVVDSVSAMVGESFKMDDWQVDIALGGSQKAFSAPIGLTIVSISEDAKRVIKDRKENIKSFYCNLTIWENYYKDKWFPYSMPISDIIALDKAVDNILEEGIERVIERHKKIAMAVRKAIKSIGLDLYQQTGFSNTVTAVAIPKEIGALNLRNYIQKEYNVILSTSIAEFENQILRIGHMGENARFEFIVLALDSIEKGLKDLGFNSDLSLVNEFILEYNKKD